MRHATFLCLALALAGCATQPQAVSVCPPVRSYTPAEEAQAAQELLTLPRDSEIGAMIVDYGRERAALRACHAATDTKP